MADICDFLSIDRPVLQAGMGGVSRADLVVAVAEAGGLGTLGYLPPAAFAHNLRRIEDALGGRAFAVNLLMPLVTRAHVAACLESRVPVVTVFFGLRPGLVRTLREAGKIVLFQVGSLAEARRCLAAGADGLIVQGVEAGGHVRGIAPLADLLPAVRDAFPDALVVGAGGIHDSATAQACRSLGADAVASGTRFLATPEAAAHDRYKRAVVEAAETVLTNLFGVGWRDPHRVIANAAVRKWCDAQGREPRWLAPLHRLTRPLAKLGSSDGGAAMAARQSLSVPLYTPSALTPEMPEDLFDVVALYAGQSTAGIKGLKPAAQVVSELA